MVVLVLLAPALSVLAFIPLVRRIRAVAGASSVQRRGHVCLSEDETKLRSSTIATATRVAEDSGGAALAKEGGPNIFIGGGGGTGGGGLVDAGAGGLGLIAVEGGVILDLILRNAVYRLASSAGLSSDEVEDDCDEEEDDDFEDDDDYDIGADRRRRRPPQPRAAFLGLTDASADAKRTPLEKTEANVQVRDKGPLTAKKDMYTAAKEASMNMHALDYDLRSALYVAACENHSDIVPYLLQLGANRLAVDMFGGTPLSDARGCQGVDNDAIPLRRSIRSFCSRRPRRRCSIFGSRAPEAGAANSRSRLRPFAPRSWPPRGIRSRPPRALPPVIPNSRRRRPRGGCQG